ncbi:MAG: glycosyltransferase [Bacteroidota bacterium]
MRKKVSCHVITYNQKNYISQCIDGILMQQTDFTFEIIIGDDNSTDGTREVLIDYQKKYPETIRLNLRTERGTGIPGKHNFVSTLEMCKGEYISLCDGDDYWTDPLKLQKQVGFLETNRDYVLCFHQINILKRDGTIVDDFITKVPEDYETIDTLARLGNYIHTPSVVFRNVLTGLPFEFEMSPIGDYFMYMMLAEHGKLKFINEKMAIYRYDVGILSGNEEVLKLKKWIDCLILIFSNSKNEKIKQILYDRYTTCFHEMYRMALKVDESNFNIIKKKFKKLKNKIFKGK